MPPVIIYRHNFVGCPRSVQGNCWPGMSWSLPCRGINGDLADQFFMKFRKKPVVIEAIQFTSESAWECCQFIGREHLLGASPEHFEIKTLEGSITASLGDWIIKGIKGEIYPCKPDIFEATYEKLDEIPAWVPADCPARLPAENVTSHPDAGK